LSKGSNDFTFAHTALERAQLLLSTLPATPPAARWDFPFPLAVFGTLRDGMENNHLMHLGRIQAHHRAFLPHFVACDIELRYRRGATAPFEIFVYESDEWHKIIGPVDRLEDFSPDVSLEHGYHRTLAWLRLLPADYDHPAYTGAMLRGERDLGIDPATWVMYERVPCWIYANLAQNRRGSHEADCPIIWDGAHFG
jgi:gamma-glutamylcyclotransferase (GGCT)/AIG2-like uncharacterized protein YtfP